MLNSIGILSVSISALPLLLDRFMTKIFSVILALFIFNGCASLVTLPLVKGGGSLSSDGFELNKIPIFIEGWKKDIDRNAEGLSLTKTLGVETGYDLADAIGMQLFLPVLGTLLYAGFSPVYGTEYDYSKAAHFLAVTSSLPNSFVCVQESENHLDSKSFLKSFKRGGGTGYALVMRINEIPNFPVEYDRVHSGNYIRWNLYRIPAIGIRTILYKKDRHGVKKIWSYVHAEKAERLYRTGETQGYFENSDYLRNKMLKKMTIELINSIGFDPA